MKVSMPATELSIAGQLPKKVGDTGQPNATMFSL
jgi:hypothetical protein